MIQPVTPQATANNVSGAGITPPPPTEQIKSTGVKTLFRNSVAATENSNATAAENENKDIEESSVQRQLSSGASARGSNLDILV